MIKNNLSRPLNSYPTCSVIKLNKLIRSLQRLNRNDHFVAIINKYFAKYSHNVVNLILR